ncbi:glycerophosphodiester phosphodiesterase [Streptomyces sp. NPDC088766]|uniref:glycerophosphodiester phosphodiesterase n=1 Tax=Streptomyces sp. NPDC088766 TaxID=3365893 RepID=UPI003810094A
MYARAVAAATTALVGFVALLFPVDDARAGIVGRPAVIAHRGASAQAPENTLAAVDAAAGLGVRWVENDVQRTKDGELVVIHDDSLERTTDAEEVFPGRSPWKVRDFTAAEVARLDAGSWFGPAYAGARVPTLREYVRRVEHHGQKLLLELKNPALYPGLEQDTLKVLADEGWLDREHLGRLVVQSFDAGSLRAVHDLAPSVTTGLLGRPPVRDLPGCAAFTDLVNPSYVSLSAEYVSAVHAVEGPHGSPLRIFVWTVDDAAAARTVAGYGVDGIITDKPDVVARALYGE